MDSDVIAHTRRFLQQDVVLSFLSGGIAGAFSRTCVSPMERVKVLYQVQGVDAKSYKGGVLKSILQIWKEEGYRGLFRGNGINCLRIFPYSSVQYATYQEIKPYLLEPGQQELSTGAKFFAGNIAGLASVTATYPLDLVKTRLSIQTASLGNLKSKLHGRTKRPPGMFQSIKHIYLNEGGARSLYRGFVPTSIGVAPYVALNFTIYEGLKELLPGSYQVHHPVVKLTLGALSGGIAQTITYPFDLLRRRFQVLTLGTGEMGFQYNSTGHALKTIVAQEGFKGLYKGWVANMWKIMPSMAVQWATYDLIKEFITGL
ncbi:BA75_04650T0 [Komagataella pastoris]|uniref:BA75_04650T0 n=1 Tax=Komagataella pastoris TaxID=4922 RepID=A0A1B2JHJ5_PICPA|nr:BA75_04650T0 [Komagataella pastoris]